MWHTKSKACFLEFNHLNTLLKYFSASPKNVLKLKNGSEIMMDEDNQFLKKKPNSENFEPYNPSYSEIMTIVDEVKKSGLLSEIAIEVLYCEM